MRRSLFPLLLLALMLGPAYAQLLPNQTGANRFDVSWSQIRTDHFTIVYHTGLEGYAREAANVAEAVYPVVTGNLRTEVPGRTLLYLSDLDDVPNAFAMDDRYIFIWMRGILDDMPLGGIRSSGRAKWLRAVITHEFTHTVIARATSIWPASMFGAPTVPRWFNEGTARFMEPDGWTADIDQVLRVAAVNGRLGYDGLVSGRLDGTLLYETGQSLVRYMTFRFGDSVLPRILHGGRDGFGYDFSGAVHEATGESLGEIYREWFRTVTALYGSEYAVREEATDISRPVVKSFEAVGGIQYAPDGSRAALLGSFPGERTRLYLLAGPAGRTGILDSVTSLRVLSSEQGFDEQFSWNPSGSRIVLSKLRYGSHLALVHDLYIFNVTSGSLDRLTSDASLTDPAWSPDGESIVAVEKRIGRDNLVLVDPASGERRRLTNFDDDTQLYTPRWSPDGKRIAFSMFDAGGMRRITLIGRDGTGLARLTSDSSNNRYPVWSPDGKRLAFTSHASGIPNIQVMKSDGSDRHFITDLAGGAFSVQWLPKSDSVVVISFDSRDGILPHLIPAGRRVTPVAEPQVLEKYRAWRTVALPKQIPPQSMIATARTEPAESYSSLAHVYPLVPFIPMGASDMSHDGTRGIRPALITFWTDPMEIHTFIGYADYGFRSEQFGGELLYMNNYLPFTLTFRGRYLFGFQGMIADRPYFQRDRGYGVEGGLSFPGANTFGYLSSVTVGLRRRLLEPWNTPADSAPQQGMMPAEAHLTEATIGVKYSTPNMFVQGSWVRSEPALGSDRQYTRLTADYAISHAMDFLDITALFGIRAAAHWGPQLPQEFLGFQKYDQFQGGFSLPHLVDPWSNQTDYRLRGIRTYRYGDRLLMASIGVAWEPDWLVRNLPLLRPLDPELVYFIEGGAVWNSNADSPAISSQTADASYGLELRSSLVNDLWLSAGVAFGKFSIEHPDLYIRLEMGR